MEESFWYFGVIGISRPTISSQSYFQQAMSENGLYRV